MADKWAACVAVLLLWGAAMASEPPRTLEELDQALSDLVREAVLPGASVAVVENGEVVLVRAYGLADVAAGKAVTPETLFKAGSTSKNLTSLLALVLQDEGLFDINVPLTRYLPDIGIDNPYAENHPITIAQLLEHTAGIEGSTYNEYATSVPALSPTDYARAIGPKLKVRWEPGYYFSYANSGHTLVAAAMEAETGESFDNLVRTRLLIPLGMSASTFSWSYADGAAVAKSYAKDGATLQPNWDMAIRPSGSLVTTAEDLAQMIKLYLARGGDLVSPEAVARMERPEESVAARAGMQLGGYGLGNFGFFEGSHPFRGHWGSTEGFRTHMGYSLDAQGGYVVMTNADDGTSHRLRGLIGGYLTRDLPPPAAVTLSDEPVDVSAWQGWYQPFTESMPLRAWLWRTLGPVRIKPTDGGFVLDPVNPFLPMRTVSSSGGAVFAEEGVSLPKLALVTDTRNQPVLINGQAFRKSGFLSTVLPFYLFVIGMMAAVVAALQTALWVPMVFLKRIDRVGIELRSAISISGIALLGMMGLFVFQGLLGDWHALMHMGTLSVLSVSLMILSLLGPAAAAVGVWRAVGLEGAPRYRNYALALTGALAIIWAYVAMSGWVPLVTFRA
ncbi:MAG: serine hydrolase domain-containing protein [Pseudomonadota bacterium]